MRHAWLLRTGALCAAGATVLLLGFYLGFRQGRQIHRLRPGAYWFRNGPVEASLTIHGRSSVTFSGGLEQGRSPGFILIFRRRGSFGVPTLTFGETSGPAGLSATDVGMRARWSFKSAEPSPVAGVPHNWWRIGGRWAEGAYKHGGFLEYHGRMFRYDRKTGEFIPADQPEVEPAARGSKALGLPMRK
jgi:hypothetical protein